MGTPQAARRESVARAVRLVLALLLVTPAAAAHAQDRPAVVPHLEIERLAGDWYEIASSGNWWHRRCAGDTRYHFELAGPRALRVASVCTTAAGITRQQGRLRAGASGDGRLSVRFAPRVFAWLPATWADYWVLAAADDLAWMLVGDNRRERLSIVSRTVSLDEAAVAQALAVARSEGYDVGRLVRVAHPAGATGLTARR